jgi:hypothetical protein
MVARFGSLRRSRTMIGGAHANVSPNQNRGPPTLRAGIADPPVCTFNGHGLAPTPCTRPARRAEAAFDCQQSMPQPLSVHDPDSPAEAASVSQMATSGAQQEQVQIGRSDCRPARSARRSVVRRLRCRPRHEAHSSEACAHRSSVRASQRRLFIGWTVSTETRAWIGWPTASGTLFGLSPLPPKPSALQLPRPALPRAPPVRPWLTA